MNSYIHTVCSLLRRTALCLCLAADVWTSAAQDRLYISNSVLLPAPCFTASDTAHILSTIRIAGSLQYSHPDSALLLLAGARDRSRELGFPDGVAMALMSMAFADAARGHTTRGVAYCQAARDYSAAALYHKGLFSSWYVNMGILNIYQGKYAVAARYFDQALHIARRSGLPEAGPHFLSIYNNISAVYMRMEQPHTALKYLVQAEHIARGSNLYRELAFTLCNKGNAFTSLQQYEKAQEAFREGLSLSRAHKLKEIEQALNNDMGNLLLKQQRPEAAIAFLKAAGDGAGQSNPLYTTILPGYNLGQAYYQMKNYALAEQYLSGTIRKAMSKGFTDGRLDAHKVLADIYEAQHKYALALQQQQMYARLKDSLLNKEKSKDINELEIKYNSAQKDKNIAEQQLLITRQQANIQRNKALIGISVLGMLLLGSSVFWIYRNNRHKQSILAGKISLLEQEQEIKLLRASIDGEEQERIRIGRELHDGIGGLLSAVKLRLGSLRLKRDMLRSEADFLMAMDLVDEATWEIRKTAHNLMPEVLSRGGITEAVKSFCERIQTGHTPAIRLQIYGCIPRLEPAFELSVYRMIQELVNNIWKHAAATEVLIQLNWQLDHFHISVEDNGCGLQQEAHEGIGLKNIRSRVQAMGGMMEIESAAGVGTSVYLTLEIHKLEVLTPINLS